MNISIRSQIFTVIAGLVGAAALCTALANGVEAGDAMTKTVRFSDLDISKSDGAKELYHRIRAAAREVCETPDSSNPIARLALHTCIDKAVDQAVKDVNEPMLTAVRFGSGDLRLASK